MALPSNWKLLPKHTVADRSFINHNGAFIPETGVYIRSGSFGPVTGSQTSSFTFSIDALAIKLRRIEVFHSGAGSFFNLSLENRSPNTGSDFDPRSIIADYSDIPGSNNFRGGIDQVEDLIALTDHVSGSEGKLYLKFMPHAPLVGGPGNNHFKFLLFFEAVMIYNNKAGEVYA